MGLGLHGRVDFALQAEHGRPYIFLNVDELVDGQGGFLLCATVLDDRCRGLCEGRGENQHDQRKGNVFTSRNTHITYSRHIREKYGSPLAKLGNHLHKLSDSHTLHLAQTPQILEKSLHHCLTILLHLSSFKPMLQAELEDLMEHTSIEEGGGAVRAELDAIAEDGAPWTGEAVTDDRAGDERVGMDDKEPASIVDDEGVGCIEWIVTGVHDVNDGAWFHDRTHPIVA